MKRPDDLLIKLHGDHPHYDEENGTGYFYTNVGFYLQRLSEMWEMTHAQVVEKIAGDALSVEEEFITDEGEYIPPHARVNRLSLDDSDMADGEVTYH